MFPDFKRWFWSIHWTERFLEGLGIAGAVVVLWSVFGIVTYALGTTKDHTCHGHNCKGGSGASQEQAQSQRQSQAQEQSQTASGGAGGAGGMASVDASGMGSNSPVNVSTNYKRNAPPVVVNSSPSTADFLVCFGLGGSIPEGGAGGLWCRLEKTLYANHVAQHLASIGLYAQSAEAWCTPKLNHRAFESKEDCERQYALSLDGVVPVNIEVAGLTLAHAEDSAATEQLAEENSALVAALARLEDRVEAREAAQRRDAESVRKERKRAEERWYEQIQKVEDSIK